MKTSIRKAIFVPEEVQEAIAEKAAKENRSVPKQLAHDYIKTPSL